MSKSNNLMDNNRRAHAAKVLAQSSKKNQSHEEETSEVETVEAVDTAGFRSLNEQYEVIREDILKLRADLADGYDLLKDYIESKVNLRTLIRAK